MFRLLSNRRMLLLVLILVTSNIAISGITFVSIYHNATRTLENTLLDIVKRQKALIYSLMEEGQDKAEILRFLKRMRERHANIGVSGELVIGENEGDSLFFIVSSKRLNMPILGHNQAIGSPMQAATLGNSGVLYGLDYLGVEVVAAYDNIPELKWGIVAKIPMKEVHEPYITAFVATVLVLFVLLSICLVLFDWLSRPIIQQLFRNEEKFRKAIEFAPFPIMLHAESGEVLSISKSWTNKTGYTHADIPTIEAWTRLAYGSKKDILKDTINNLYKLTGPKDEGEFVVNCKDNRQLVWDFSSAPLDLHLDGKRTVISIAMDVTDRKRIEAELLESAYFFKKSQEAAFTGSYKANFETDIWYSSEVLDAIFGIDAAYVRSVEGWLKLIHPDDRAFMAEYLNKEVIQPNAQFDREYRIVRQNDNCVRWVHGLGVVDTNSDGIVKALIGTIQDITERKEYEISLYEKNVEIEAQIEEYRQLNEELAQTKDLIEESEHELKAIYRAASDVAFVSIDYDGKEYTISSFSPGAEKIFGFTAGEILGKPFSTINPAESGINSEDTQEWLTSTPKGIRVEQILVRKNAEIFPAMFTLYPIKTKRNGVRSLLAIAIDITDIKKTQLELILAKEKAEESDRLKTAFLQNMSHEIRTPMNAIIGFSNLLHRNFSNIEKLEKFTEIISQRSKDLLDIINDILDIARIESGQVSLNYEKISILKLFTEIKLTFVQQKSLVRFEFDQLGILENTDIELLTDKGKIKQIFINLIGNAFKFTNEGSIRVGYILDCADSIKFYVSDSGIGISAEKFEVIFDRFMQLETGTSRQYGGTGLGLAIVKGLLEILGGKIWLESELGKGSTFYFSIPYTNIRTQKNKMETSVTNQGLDFRNRTILIVEDDAYNALYLEEILSVTEVNTLQTTMGTKAIELCNSESIDLVLMDIRLPDITGYEATKEIKSKYPNLPIIAQTAYAASGDRQRAFDAGCNDYVSKPMSPDELLAVLTKYLI